MNVDIITLGGKTLELKFSYSAFSRIEAVLGKTIPVIFSEIGQNSGTMDIRTLYVLTNELIRAAGGQTRSHDEFCSLLDELQDAEDKDINLNATQVIEQKMQLAGDNENVFDVELEGYDEVQSVVVRLTAFVIDRLGHHLMPRAKKK